MALPYDEILTTPTFQFMVGPEKKEFHLHIGAIARVSEHLDSLIDDTFAKSNVKHKWLKEEDPKTFSRFSQYLYTFDYAEPEPETDPWMLHWKDGSSTALTGLTSAPSQRCGNGSHTSETVGEWDTFMNKKFPSPKSLIPRQSNQVHENYRPVFLGHANVYVFALKYDIDGLGDLALKKLHAALCEFQLYPERISDIAKLLKFVHEARRYSHDGLRKLVMEYAACKIEELVDNPAMKALAVEAPDSLKLELFNLMKDRMMAKKVAETSASITVGQHEFCEKKNARVSISYERALDAVIETTRSKKSQPETPVKRKTRYDPFSYESEVASENDIHGPFLTPKVKSNAKCVAKLETNNGWGADESGWDGPTCICRSCMSAEAAANDEMLCVDPYEEDGLHGDDKQDDADSNWGVAPSDNGYWL